MRLLHFGNVGLGSKEFWEISNNLNSDDEEELYDPNSRDKKRGPKINVKKSVSGKIVWEKKT